MSRRPVQRSVAPPSTGDSSASRAPTGRLRDIYLHASRLFVERGYEGTSMDALAEAVNITKGSLYHFVDGKEDLLFKIMMIGMDELEEEVVRPAAAIADPLERLRFIVGAHLRNIGRGSGPTGNPVTIVVDEPWNLSPEMRKVITHRKRAYFDMVRSAVAALQAEGRADPGLDSAVAAHTITGLIQWMARWRRREGRLSLDAIIDDMTTMTLNLIGAPSR